MYSTGQCGDWQDNVETEGGEGRDVDLSLTLPTLKNYLESCIAVISTCMIKKRTADTGDLVVYNVCDDSNRSSGRLWSNM